MTRFPALDPCHFDVHMNRIAELAAAYTPEWRVEADRGVGWGLSRVACHYLDEITKRLNRAPDKAFVAFLNMLGADRKPPLPARAPVHFSLAPGAPEAVILEAGTTVAGAAEETVAFSTESALAISPSQLRGALWVRGNRVCDLKGRPLSGEQHAGDRGEPVHLGYIHLPADAGDPMAVSYLLHLDGDNLHLFDPSRGRIQFAYSGEGGIWTPFSEVSFDGETLTLTKERGLMEPREIGEREGIWFRLRYRMDEERDSDLMFLTGLIVTGPVPEGGAEAIHPTAAVDNDTFEPVDVNEPLAPFTRKPELFDGVYLAFPATLARPGLEIAVALTLEQAGEPSEDCRIIWDFYDGLDWRPIPGLADGTARLTRDGTVRFTTPEDIAATGMAGTSGAWLRIRLVDGDYGAVRLEVTESELVETEDFHPPVIAAIELSMVPPQLPAALYAEKDYNADMDARRVTPEEWLQSGNKSRMAVYLGLDAAPLRGPCGLFLDIAGRFNTGDEQFRVNYWNGVAWTPLDVEDDTRNLSESGVLRFLPPKNFQPATLARIDAHWLSLSGGPIGVDHQPVRNAWFNTTWAVQLEQAPSEFLGPSEGTANQTFRLDRAPVSELELWVDEAELLSLGQKEALRRSGRFTIDEQAEDDDEAAPFRILWKQVPSLSPAGPGDRVYCFSAATGEIFFGDGKNGEIPPIGDEVILARYKISLGSMGNLPEGVVADLQTTIPFLDAAQNPLPASGGVDLEETEAAARRGPWRLSHRNRAVSTRDFERLAIEAGQSVAAARCIPGSPGTVSLALLPRASRYPAEPSFQLLRRVRDFLLSAGPATLDGDQLLLKGPRYLRARVHMTLVFEELDDSVQGSKTAAERLAGWFHPITGRDGRGPQFGMAPSLDDLTNLLQELPGRPSVSVEAVHLHTVEGEAAQQTWRIDKTRTAVVLPPDSLVFGDRHGHSISVRIRT
ncbi:MAG: baseplate J/gp47 family protein [Acidobacteriota bacterium]|nr:baseplate J/gp47 family protein [Acidobacteriota bacterium]